MSAALFALAGISKGQAQAQAEVRTAGPGIKPPDEAFSNSFGLSRMPEKPPN